MRAKFQSKMRSRLSRASAKCVAQAVASAEPSSRLAILLRVPQWEMAALQMSLIEAIRYSGQKKDRRRTVALLRCGQHALGRVGPGVGRLQVERRHQGGLQYATRHDRRGDHVVEAD